MSSGSALTSGQATDIFGILQSGLNIFADVELMTAWGNFHSAATNQVGTSNVTNAFLVPVMPVSSTGSAYGLDTNNYPQAMSTFNNAVSTAQILSLIGDIAGALGPVLDLFGIL